MLKNEINNLKNNLNIILFLNDIINDSYFIDWKGYNFCTFKSNNKIIYIIYIYK